MPITRERKELSYIADTAGANPTATATSSIDTQKRAAAQQQTQSAQKAQTLKQAAKMAQTTTTPQSVIRAGSSGGSSGAPVLNYQYPNLTDRTPFNAETAKSKLAGYETGTRPTYTQSDVVDAALEKWQDMQAPDAFQSRYQSQIDGLLDKVLNPDPFSYDLQNDASYQAYRDQYLREGKRAMQDTLGNAAALTGGYGSSYGQSVGNQAYNNYLAQLNAVVPQLEQQAYSRYRDDVNDRYNQLSALNNQDAVDYARYRDLVGDYQTDRAFNYGVYQDARDTDYNRYRDSAADYESDRDYWLNYANLANQQLNQQAEWDLAQAQLDAQNAAAKGSSSGGSGSARATTTGTASQTGTASAASTLKNSVDNVRKLAETVAGSVSNGWDALKQAALQKVAEKNATGTGSEAASATKTLNPLEQFAAKRVQRQAQRDTQSAAAAGTGTGSGSTGSASTGSSWNDIWDRLKRYTK